MRFKSIVITGIFCILSLTFFSFAQAQDVRVRGHYRSDGTYVPEHYRTRPDNNPWNNYSTRGNINPRTGEEGTVDPWDRGSGTGSLLNPGRTRSRSLFDD